MRISISSKELENKLFNIVDYSFGFIEGAKRGKIKFLDNLGKSVIDALSMYIDSEARANPSAYHHVYEWYRTGSPDSRLFNITTTVSNNGLSFYSTFKQSNSVQEDSNVPFYNKAYIMENGVPVTIKPKRNVLVFKDAGKTIFTKKEITVANPGGTDVVGSYEKVFDEFFNRYFTQAFLNASGLVNYINNPTIYKKNAASGSKGGKNVGLRTGYAWIVNAKVGIE